MPHPEDMTVTMIPDAILASARHTADAWGEAYIGITRSAPCSRHDYAAGGRWHVTRSQANTHYTGHPTTWLARVDEDGTVTRLTDR